MIIVQFLKAFFSVYRYTKNRVQNWGVAVIKAEKKVEILVRGTSTIIQIQKSN
jgi:hypothetical protein